VKRLGDGNVCHTGERTCFYRRLQNGTTESTGPQTRTTENTGGKPR